MVNNPVPLSAPPAPMTPLPPKKLLVISNGHGEDAVACNIIDALRDITPSGLLIDCWPMVGEGKQYQKRNIPIVGPLNRLPSCGLAWLDPKLYLKDLQAGLFRTHFRQIRAGFTLRHKYDLILAVGDLVVILAAIPARTPFLFVGCAKSAFYSKTGACFTSFERMLLRRFCRLSFPRDQLTSQFLTSCGVHNRSVGNPMMDGLQANEKSSDLPDTGKTVAFLPGSRDDAPSNTIDLIRIGTAMVKTQKPELTFLVACHDDYHLPSLDVYFRDTTNLHCWQPETSPPSIQGRIACYLHNHSGSRIIFLRHRFADILNRSDLVIGMAGTANEQAVGLGKPLLVYPAAELQGQRYADFKQNFFGPAAITSKRCPTAASKLALKLLNDEMKCQAMGIEGKKRMGGPGASAAIAEEIASRILPISC